MVPNYRRGKLFGRAIAYVLNDKLDPSLPRHGARVIALGNLTSIETAGVEMKAFAALSPRCRRPMVHWTVSLAPDEKLSDDQWRYVGSRLRKEVFGFDDDSFQSVLVLHDVVSADSVALAHQVSRRFRAATKPRAGCQHLHLIDNAVSIATGRTPSDHWDSNIQIRLQAACRELEKELGLRQLRGYALEEGKAAEPRLRSLGQPTAGEIAREARTGIRPLVDDRDVILLALAPADWDLRACALAELGLVLKPARNKDGSIKGASVVEAANPKRAAKLSAFVPNGLKSLDAVSLEPFGTWLERSSGLPKPAAPQRSPDRSTLLQKFQLQLADHRRRRADWQALGRQMTFDQAASHRALRTTLAAEQPSVADAQRIDLALAQVTLDVRRQIERLRRLYRRLRHKARLEALRREQRAARRRLWGERPGRQPTWSMFVRSQAERGDEVAVRELERLSHRLQLRGRTPSIELSTPVPHTVVTKAPARPREPSAPSLSPAQLRGQMETRNQR